MGLVVKLCDLPLCNKVTDETSEALKAALLDCSYRLHKNQHGMWQVQVSWMNKGFLEDGWMDELMDR